MLRRALKVGLALAAAASPAWADTVVASRMLRAETVIGPNDLIVQEAPTPGALSDPLEVIGREARVNIYAGRPIRAADLAAPAVIARNQVVSLNYHHAGLVIATEGRALDRAGPGERIRVLNLSSRTTVTGTVLVDGTVSVGPGGN